MGIILSRVRKKKSTIDTLEKLDNDIKEIEENRVNAQRKYKEITKLLLIYTVGLYILCGIILYFQYTSTLQGKLLYLVPLALSPLLLYVIKRVISWYFVRLIGKNEKRLNDMRKEKKKILEDVMNTETYKVAKEILERFSNEPVIKPSYNTQLATPKKIDDVIRRRAVPSAASAPVSQIRFPSPPHKPMGGSPMPSSINSATRVNRPMPVSSSPFMPAPILPLQRSYVDRIVEYLIGDGPNNRYALICSKCHSHNGMALKEEFEYIGYKCCYCCFYNPARKIRPEAPKLETPSRVNQESDSDSEKTSGEISDIEPKPILGTPVNELGDKQEKEAEATESAISESADIVEDNKPEPENIINSNPPPEEKCSEETEVEETPEEDVNSNQSVNDPNCDESVVES